jgi:hypothetical protein
VFLLDVFIEETSMAIISSFSVIRESINGAKKISISLIISSQNKDSLASSSTIESFEMKSALDLALQADL